VILKLGLSNPHKIILRKENIKSKKICGINLKSINDEIAAAQ